MAMYNEITVTAELTNTEYMITKNYNLLENKPQINSVELIGNKSLEDLGINPDAEPNVIDTVKVNGSALTPDENKAVDVTVTTGTANGTVKVNGSDVAVKGLKSAAFTESTAYDAAGSAAEVHGEVEALSVVVNGKVDKVQGKGLSTNDYTDADKTKLAGIQAGAQVNTVTSVAGKTGAVNLQKSDVGLGNVDNTSDLNKPISTATQTALDGKVDKVAGKGLSQNDFTNELKSKLDGIESGAEVNVQADWNQTDSSADDFIKNKPSLVGEIPDLISGGALSLVTPAITDKSPYVFRQSANGLRNLFGVCNMRSLIGGTVAFNQLVQNGNFVDTSNWSQQRVTLSVSNNVGSVTLTATNDPYLDQQFVSLANHKYLYCAEIKRANSNANVRFIAYYNGTTNNKTHTSTTDNWEQACLIVDNTTAGNNRVRITEVDTKTVGDTFSVKNVMVTDLTQMFGSTIADYIYSLEQATAGSGVAYFRSLFPKDYYAYNAGQLMSVKALSHKMIGFNQWDEITESGYISNADGSNIVNNNYVRSVNYDRCLPQTAYTMTKPSGVWGSIFWYDYNKTFISAEAFASDATKVFVSPNNAYYFRICVKEIPYQNNVCLNFHWDGSRDGEYEPYKKNSYDLSGSHEVQRKYAEVDLGSLDYIYNAETQRFQSSISDMKSMQNARTLPMICPIYECKCNGETFSADWNMVIYNAGGVNIQIHNHSYTDATTFKTAMNGVKLVYPLETPTTETVTNPILRGIPKLDANNNLYYDGDSFSDFQNLQIVDDFGTEEFIDAEVTAGNRDVAIPAGHETDYRQEIELPALPTTNGNYNLQFTKSASGVTTSFVSTS